MAWLFGLVLSLTFSCNGSVLGAIGQQLRPKQQQSASVPTSGNQIVTDTNNHHTGNEDNTGNTGNTGVPSNVPEDSNAVITTKFIPQNNPFAGAVMYVNPDYSNNVSLTAKQISLSTTEEKFLNTVKNLPTAIWLDRMAAITGGSQNGGRLSLKQHLDGALALAKKSNQPAVVVLVIYDLPDRDCAALASNGELHGVADLPTYEQQYIDVITQLFQSNADYQKNIHLVLIIEPDSLPNMITNQNNPQTPNCITVFQEHLYEKAVTYAIQSFSQLQNAYMYLDIGHSGWLGFSNNMSLAVTFYQQLVNNATSQHPEYIRGLVTNVANYTPFQEAAGIENNQTLISGPFYQSNPEVDEWSYMQKLSESFQAIGITSWRFMTDTSRNGWKAEAPGIRLDQRKARGNWCNVKNTGLGIRPTMANSRQYPILDAFFYVKPPGESDGMSQPANANNSPDAEGKRYDPNCDPSNVALDALGNAPAAGDWFSSEFKMLMDNATPAL